MSHFQAAKEGLTIIPYSGPPVKTSRASRVVSNVSHSRIDVRILVGSTESWTNMETEITDIDKKQPAQEPQSLIARRGPSPDSEEEVRNPEALTVGSQSGWVMCCIFFANIRR